MPETLVSSLPGRLQKQVDNARTAADRDNGEYAINICRTILLQHPGCLAVRRLLRAVHLKRFRAKNGFLGKVGGSLAGMPALFAARSALKKEPARALDTAERALGAAPTNAAALRVAAQAAMALELPETAVFYLEAIVEQSPGRRPVMIDLADACIAAGRAPDALAIAERLLAEAPGDGQVQELVKRASVAKSITAGRWESATSSYRDKLRDEQQAVSLEQANKAATSEEMSRRLIDETLVRVEAEPGNLNHHRSLIQAYRALGQLDASLEWLGRARALPTGAADVSLAKLESDLRLARLEARIRGRTEVVRAVEGDPERDAELAALRDELAAQRIRDLKEFVAKYPNDLNFRHELGRLHLAAGHIDSAIQQFQMSQRSPKLRTPALRGLGQCFQAKRLYDLAVQQYETAKAEIGVLDDEKKEVIYQLAVCYEAMGRTEKALEEFKLIYAADIGFRDVAARIGASYPKTG